MPSPLTPGAESQVNTITPSYLSAPEDITTLSDGSYVITWYGGTPPTYDVYAQHYSADGQPVGGEILVNTTIAETQQEPAVVGLKDGGFVIVWVGGGTPGTNFIPGIFAQRFSATGERIDGESLIVAGAITARYFTTSQPTAATLADGGYALAWTLHADAGNLRDQVMTQQFNADGSARGTAVPVDASVTQGQYWFPDIAPLADGGYVIVWTYNPGPGNDVFTQRYDSSGAAVGDKVTVNTYQTGQQDQTAIAGLSGGGYVVIWQSYAQPGGDQTDIYAQAYDAAGARLGEETRVNSYTTNTQFYGDVTALSDGGYVVTWSSNPQDGSGYNIYAQQFDSAGLKTGDETLINAETAGQQYVSHVTALPHGGFIVTWYTQVTGSPVELHQRLFASLPSIDGTQGDDVLNGTAANDVINGLVGNDVLNGLAGDDVMDGGSGNDTMAGGAGNDTYGVNTADDVVTEAAGAGTDLVKATVTYTLGDNVESLSLLGTANLNAMGNSLANLLTGNAGNNLLDGKAGADAMKGGAGNDTYVVDNAADVVTELASEGTDVVQSSARFTLGDNVERLVLTGTAGIAGTGNGLANVLTGNSGNNRLDGGLGADSLVGGAGDDAYVVDDAGDRVFENVNEGNDSVSASFSYSLGTQYVENLTLTGTADLTATGNALANTLIGNAGNNMLNGGNGIDNLWGGAGDDSYYVDNVSDRTFEKTTAGADAGGHDVVYTSVRVTLDQFVEDLVITGTNGLAGTGNALNNTITGNSGNNALLGKDGDDVLDGGTAIDTMAGGQGNDTYFVDNGLDRVAEANGQGYDTVYSSVSFSLGNQFVETLTLTGDGAINATGNAIANDLSGNDAANQLDGGRGNDTLQGRGGADIFVFGLQSGLDTITDFSATDGDSLNLNAYAHGTINGGGIVVAQAGADTLITLGGGNSITLTGTLSTEVFTHIVW